MPHPTAPEQIEELTDHSVIAAVSGQVSSELEEERVILHLENGTYYGLNPVGARIWDLIQEPVTLGAVREQLLAEYDVNAERCERDLRALIRDLAEEALIEIREQ